MGWILFIIGVIGWHLGMYGMFKKAGIEPWKALIPFYNTWCIVQKTNLKKYWFFLQFIPIAGQFITIWITIIFTMHFGRFNVLHHAGVIFLPFLYFPYLGFSKNEKFAGQKVFDNYSKPNSREWIDALVFAVVAATIIRSFVFEAYVIPTGSMEKTLMVNDFLFVNKMTYGPRIPQTPLSFPFVHNLLPKSQIPSYFKWIQIPYKRLPAFSPVKRNDVVVFNFPQGDTVINLPEFGSAIPFYQMVRAQGREQVEAEYGDKIIVHPMDKADNYIKRCVAIAGEEIEIKDGILYVNGVKSDFAEDGIRSFNIYTTGNPLDFDSLKNNYGINIREDEKTDEYFSNLGSYYANAKYYPSVQLSTTDVEKLKKLPFIKDVVYEVYNRDDINARRIDIFPNDTVNYKTWDVDNYGKLTIPKKGVTINITPQNISIYRRLISTYEGHKLEETNGQLIIDGKPVTTYTFKYDYYWMMGDARHRSQDSRFWGFVPETHIVGKASLIWFSWQKGPRWKRLFKSIK